MPPCDPRPLCRPELKSARGVGRSTVLLAQSQVSVWGEASCQRKSFALASNPQVPPAKMAAIPPSQSNRSACGQSKFRSACVRTERRVLLLQLLSAGSLAAWAGLAAPHGGTLLVKGAETATRVFGAQLRSCCGPWQTTGSAVMVEHQPVPAPLQCSRVEYLKQASDPFLSFGLRVPSCA